MKKFKKYCKALIKNKPLLITLIIFGFEIFLRFYQMDVKNPFGYDQVDNAWIAKNLIVNHQLPLVGMVAKTDSGIYIGPLYYYFVSIFYWILNLNPIASQLIASVTAIFNFWVIYFVFRKIFNPRIAIIALLINVFSFPAILFEGIQWPVQLLPAISLLIFYFLYKVVTGKVRNIIPLAILIGIAFSLHFTAVFFPIIVLLSLPLFPRNKETLKYVLISLPLFIIFLIPNIIYAQINNHANSTAASYITTYFHGFHLVRMKQLLGDAFIQFDPYLSLSNLRPLKYLLLLLFIISYLFKSLKPDGKKFIYLFILWFLVPWFVFTTYSGEISDYYFIINRFLALAAISYLIFLVFDLKYLIVKAVVIVFFAVYCWYGVSNYLPYRDPGNLYKKEQYVQQMVGQNRRIEFQVGVPESYLYYYYMETLKGVQVYVSKTK